LDSITFLGTGGARVLVFKQLLASGGLWLELIGKRLSLDPGPGALVQMTRRKLDPTHLDAVLLSHCHLDHSADVNSVVEAMTTGGFKRRGMLFAPRDALEGDPVVLRYLRGYLNGIVILEEGGSYQLGELRFRTPVRNRHGVETYGFVFELPGYTLSYLSDTAYFPELASHYRADVMILNTVRLEESDIPHLSLPEAKRIISQAKPKAAILTHFGMTVWRARPWELAQRLSEETGVKVVAARDGMKLELPVTI